MDVTQSKFTITKVLRFILVTITSFTVLLGPLTIYAQSNVNAINLTIPKVTKNDQTELTQNAGNNAWSYDGELTLDDAIRYGWNAVSLDIGCKDTPQPGCGYLKVYLEDASSESNLITEFGFSPLPVDRLAPRLEDGENTIVFVYIDSQNPADTSTQVSFTFDFSNTTTRPQITVVEPTQDALFGRGIDREFELELNNFTLEATDSGLPNRGKLNVYYSSINPSNLLGTLSTSTQVEDNTSVVSFTSEDLSFEGIPDSLNTKLIFALTETDGNLLNINSEISVRTNYDGSLDVGLPKVTITEPRKDRTNLNVDTNQKFIVQIDNFEILPEFQAADAEEGVGYLQILIDDAPVKTVWPKNNFSFAEIGVADMSEGRKTVKVELVNKDLSKLVPEAFDTIDVVYTPTSIDDAEDATTQVQNNVWRIIMVIFIVVLVIGGIAVLITKG
jgi:hypothetical protein